MHLEANGELPVGLAMQLAMHEHAMLNFSALREDQRAALVRFVQGAQTGEEAKQRIQTAVERLEAGAHTFF